MEINAITGQHEFDADAHPALGPPIRPAPTPPAPRRFNSDGTIWQAPDGKLSTAIPPPPFVNTLPLLPTKAKP